MVIAIFLKGDGCDEWWRVSRAVRAEFGLLFVVSSFGGCAGLGGSLRRWMLQAGG